jgi:hypothetical protein
MPSAGNPGQSFSVANGSNVGPFMIARGSMGATYAGGNQPLSYRETASFTLNSIGGAFIVDFLGDASLGNGFDNAQFQIYSNGALLFSQSFDSLAAADAFFSNDLLDLQVGAGLDNIQLTFDETLSGGDGFSYDYAVSGAVSAAPLPPSWMMMTTGLLLFGVFAHRKTRKKATASA